MLLSAVLGFAVLAAAALVLSDDARWLRLGIVAALWAALVGAFAAARYRREIAADHDRSDELRRVYELELEREVAARREYELEVEADTRRRLEQEVRNEVRGELDGLRSELRTLRQNLEALLGGEVLVERVALRAESTRLRSLSDQSRAARSADRALPQGTSRTGQQWHAGFAPDVQDAELVEPRQAAPTRSEPAAEPARQSAAPQPQPARAGTTHERPDPRYVQPGRVERSEPRRADPSWPERTAPRRVEPAWPDRSEPHRVQPAWPGDPEPRRAEPAWPGGAEPPRRAEPAWSERSEPHRVDARQGRSEQRRVQPADPTDILPRYQGTAASVPDPAGRPETSQPLDFRPLRRSEPSRAEPPMADPVYADPLTSPAWDRGDPWPAATSPETPAAHGNGGRRRRQDDEPPYTGRRRAADEDAGTSAGRSVDDLIASYGNESPARRRHRRDDG